MLGSFVAQVLGGQCIAQGGRGAQECVRAVRELFVAGVERRVQGLARLPGVHEPLEDGTHVGDRVTGGP